MFQVSTEHSASRDTEYSSQEKLPYQLELKDLLFNPMLWKLGQFYLTWTTMLFTQIVSQSLQIVSTVFCTCPDFMPSAAATLFNCPSGSSPCCSSSLRVEGHGRERTSLHTLALHRLRLFIQLHLSSSSTTCIMSLFLCSNIRNNLSKFTKSLMIFC